MVIVDRNHMLTPDQVQTIQHTVSLAKTILVIYSPQASVDQVAAAVALHKGLLTLGKSSTLLSPIKPAHDFSVVDGVDQTATELGNKNLEVSFDYQEDMVDKVSYNIDEEAKKFRLIIQPRKDAKPLDSKTVEFSYTGADADAIFLVGVSGLDSLDALYVGYEQLYQDVTSISINSYETPYGSIKVSTMGAASTSEVMAYLLQELGVEITSDIATNLITGIELATDKMQSLATTADTFEIISKLLRAGGRRTSRSRNNLTAAGLAHINQQPNKSSKGEVKKTEVKKQLT